MFWNRCFCMYDGIRPPTRVSRVMIAMTPRWASYNDGWRCPTAIKGLTGFSQFPYHWMKANFKTHEFAIRRNDSYTVSRINSKFDQNVGKILNASCPWVTNSSWNGMERDNGKSLPDRRECIYNQWLSNYMHTDCGSTKLLLEEMKQAVQK